MSIYSQLVLPRLLDFTLRYEELSKVREKVIPAARGVVLEVGVGSGLNLPYYDASRVSRLYALDPAGELIEIARKRAATTRFPVTFLHQSSDVVQLPDRSVDTVVITWSLCSIEKPERALAEVRRVLNDDGELIFAEHGLSPDKAVLAWQNRLTPVWRRLAGGCHLNRKIDDLIRAAGFSITALETLYIPGPKLVTYSYIGMARRA